MKRNGGVDRALARLIYGLVIVGLALATLGCMVLVFGYGFSALGIAGLAGALVCVAVLLSYAGSMSYRKGSPAP